MSQFFFNQCTHLVNDVIDGTIIASPWNNLAYLKSDPVICIVVRRDFNKNNVAVIFGGGPGHEPVHVGFIGKGMLAATVCGDAFASPSIDVVLATIQAVTDETDCLLIVRNHTGGRLNSGLAAGEARRPGCSAEMLAVGDDISLLDNKRPHGIAGTVLVHKITGCFAEHGYNLVTVLYETRYAANNIFSLGAAFSSCHLPQKTDAAPRYHLGHVELDVGIHGEPDASVIDTQNNAQMVSLMVNKLLAVLSGTDRLTVMINDLGGVSVAEMATITHELASSPLHPRTNWLIDPASLVTTLDVKGFSLMVIVLEESIEKALLTEVETSNWSTSVPPRKINCVPSSRHNARVEFQPLTNTLVVGIVELVTTTLSDLETHPSVLDAKVGDGDTGLTFAAGAREIASLLHRQQLPLDNLATLFVLVGGHLTVVAGGSSGVLMSIFFTAAGQKLEQGTDIAEALNTGLAQTKFYGGASEGDRIMIDALQPVLASLLAQPKNLQAAFNITQAGAKRTCLSSKTSAGRVSYLSSENPLGDIGPGTHTVAMVFKALTESELN